MQFELLKIDWTAIGSIATFFAVFVALYQSNTVAYQQRKRDAHMVGKVAVIFARAVKLIEEVEARIAAGEKPRDIGQIFQLVGGFEGLIHAAESVSLSDLSHPKAADELLRGRTALRNCQGLIVRLSKNQNNETELTLSTLREAFDLALKNLAQMQAYYEAPWWRRLRAT